MPRFPVPERFSDDSAYLRERVLIGATERWGDTLSEAQMKQVDHELGVIDRLGYSGFFLVMWDAVNFAQSQGILCQGRGSAANSVVAYLLGITAVDPVRHGLLFERFLSEKRTDGKTGAAGHRRRLRARPREEVLDYVYESTSGRRRRYHLHHPELPGA
jgi:error-prone DNA polymerase